jgi:hypothetical protein
MCKAQPHRRLGCKIFLEPQPVRMSSIAGGARAAPAPTSPAAVRFVKTCAQRCLYGTLRVEKRLC